MIFKTKLLLSLGTLGVLGGASTGIYYLKNNLETTQKNSESAAPAPEAPAPAISSALPNGGERDTSRIVSSVVTPPNSQPPKPQA